MLLSRRFAFAFTVRPLIVICPSFHRNHAIIFFCKEASDASQYGSERVENETFGMSKNLFHRMLREVQNITVNSRISGAKETNFDASNFLSFCFLPGLCLFFACFLPVFCPIFARFLPENFRLFSLDFPVFMC